MIQSEFREILYALLKKTQAKQVNWVDTLDPESRGIDLDYTVFLPDSSINLYRIADEPAMVSILNAQGNVIFSVDETQDVEVGQLLNQLIESARNSILNVDTTVAYLRKILSSNDVIGDPKPEI